jgi:hypothetical protein
LPIVGLAIRALSPILVPVTDKQRETLPSAKEQLTERIKSKTFNRSLIIFPEGTTTQADTLVKFQDGAFMDRVPVQPIVLKYSYDNLDPSWTVDIGPFRLMFRMCCQFVNYLHVDYLSPVVPDENDDVENYKKKVVNVFLNHHFEKSVLTVRDSHFLKKMMEFHKIPISYICNYIYMNCSYGISVYSKMSDLSINQLEKIITKYYSVDSSVCGKLYIDDFKKFIVCDNLFSYIKNINHSYVTFYDIITLFDKLKSFDFDFLNNMNLILNKNFTTCNEIKMYLLSLLYDNNDHTISYL